MKLTEVTAKKSASVNLNNSLKIFWDEHKSSVKKCDCENNEIAKECWETDHNFT